MINSPPFRKETEWHDFLFSHRSCAISYILNDWTGFDTQKTTEFILNSQVIFVGLCICFLQILIVKFKAFDGGFGLGPGLEGHGGSTYCAVASLWLMKKLSLIKHKEKLLKWCIDMQGSGFQGRPNKPPDSCYSYWIGATMRLLGSKTISISHQVRIA